MNLQELLNRCHDRLTVVYKSHPAMQARRTIDSLCRPVTDELLLFKGGDFARTDVSQRFLGLGTPTRERRPVASMVELLVFDYA